MMPSSQVANDPEPDRSLTPVRPAIAFAFFNAMTWQVALGTPMVLFAESLGASAAAVGLAYSFVFLLTPVQVLATSFLPRYGFRRMMLSGWGARSLFLLPPVVLAWMQPEEGEGVVAIFIGSLFLFTFFRSIGSCAWLPWINSLLTPENRGKYFATEQAVSGVSGVATLLVCSVSLQVMPLYAAFLLQYSFAFVGSWLAYVSLARLPDAPRPSAIPLNDVVRETPRLIFEPGRFREFVILCVITGVAVTAIPPFCAYYLKVVPQVPASRIVLYTLSQYCGVIVGSLLIRDHIDRVGARPFFLLAMAAYIAVVLYWLAVLRGFAGGEVMMPAMYLLLGVAASCWSSAVNKYLPLVVAAENRTLAYSVHGAVTSVVAGLSPVIWGLFIKGASDMPSVDVRAFQAYFVVALFSALIVAVLVRRLPREAGAGHEVFLGGAAMRPFRGLTYLASLVQLTGRNEPSPQRKQRGEQARRKEDER